MFHADALSFPRAPSLRSTYAGEMLQVFAVSVVIALFGSISIPLPFTPVPLATQPHVIVFFAALLGSRKAFFATLLFLVEGALGFPVFSGAKGGMVCLAGPTGGYLLGYLVSAYVVGYLVERRKEYSSLQMFCSLAIGNMVIYLFGWAWLSTFVGYAKAAALGVLPFLVGDLLKIVAVQKLLKRKKPL